MSKVSNGMHAVEPVSPGPNAFATSPAPSPSGTSKSSRPSGSSSSKSRQRTIRENAKPRVDSSSDGLNSPIVTEDGGHQGCDRRSSEEVETGERWKGRGSPEGTAAVEASGSAAPTPAPRTPSEHSSNGHGTNGSALPPTAGSKSGRRHVRDTSVNGMEKEMSSENLMDAVQGRTDDTESTSRRSQTSKGDGDLLKKDADSETICNWLAQVGLPQYAPQFLAHHVTPSNLEELDKEALHLIGVQSWGHRCVILKSIARLKEGNAGSGEEEAAVQGPRGSGPGGRKRGGERDRSQSQTAAAGATGLADSHDSLKNVYEQIENMKMHFEAQMEQLNRELLATKAELANVKGAVAAQQAANNANGGGKGGGKGGNNNNNSSNSNSNNNGGNSESDSKNGAGVGRNGKQQQRRKDNADTAGEGNGGNFGFNSQQQVGMGGQGQLANAQYMRPVAQGMTYGQPVYANMMHPGQQYFYGSMGMGMGGGYEGYDASAGQYYIQPVMQQQQAMQGVAVGADGYGTFESGGMIPVQMQSSVMQSGAGEVPAQEGANGAGAGDAGDASGGM